MSLFDSFAAYVAENTNLDEVETDECLDKAEICCSQEVCMDNTYANIRAFARERGKLVE